MLKTVDLSGKFDRAAPCVMLLGGFDGVHAGHRRLAERAKRYSLPVGIMTIGGGKGEKSLFTFSEREDIFKGLGLDFAFELPFSEIRELPPEAFIDLLKSSFQPEAFVCGSDFRFGFRASGTPALIAASGVRVETEELLCIDGEKVSSSSIKRLLSEGDAAAAAKLLGEPFFLKGKVIRDRQVGRLMGFPTANVLYPEEKFPLKEGVYEARTEVEGREYKCIANFGSRPTFGDERVLTETYLDGFSGDLYGRTIEVRFIRYLRGVKKFDGADALKRQLESVIRRVRQGD